MEEIAKLRSQVRLQWVALAIIAASCLVGWRSSPGVVQATRFEVVDDAGKLQGGWDKKVFFIDPTGDKGSISFGIPSSGGAVLVASSTDHKGEVAIISDGSSGSLIVGPMAGKHAEVNAGSLALMDSNDSVTLWSTPKH
jgi:hypothetical protein